MSLENGKQYEFVDEKEILPVLRIPKEENPIGYDMRYVHFKGYNPVLSSKQLPIDNQDLQGVLQQSYKKDTLNLKNTHPEKVRDFVVQYIAKNPEILKKFGVSNILDMNPNQAALVAGQIISDRLKYDRESTLLIYSREQKGERFLGANNQDIYLEPENNRLLPKRKIRAIGERFLKTQDMPVEDLLARYRWGVCRHYSRTFTAIFDALKSIQQGTKLLNTYTINVGSNKMNHAFNLLVTVEPDKRLHLSVVDPTWSDVDLVTIQKKKLGIKTAGFQENIFDATLLFGHDANSNLFNILASNAYLRTPRYSMMLNEAAKNQFDIEVDYRRRLWEVADFGFSHSKEKSTLEIKKEESTKKITKELLIKDITDRFNLLKRDVEWNNK